MAKKLRLNDDHLILAALDKASPGWMRVEEVMKAARYPATDDKRNEMVCALSRLHGRDKIEEELVRSPEENFYRWRALQPKEEEMENET